jgi:GNAT superfamily N-acetyltransferase
VLTPAEQADRAAAGLREVWRAQCEYVDGGEVAERHGILIAATRLPDETLNCAFVTAPPPDVEAALDWCTGWFAERGLRTGIELRVGQYPDVEAALAARAFGVVVRRPAMTLPLPVALPEPPPRVSVREVADDADLAAFQAVQAAAFDLTPEVAERFVPPAARERVTLLLACYDDVPAATAGVSRSAYGAGLVGVATLRAYRRRGLGRAVTAAAVAYAAERGDDLAWLYPTPMAQRLYAGLGFAVCDDVQVWVERRD